MYNNFSSLGFIFLLCKVILSGFIMFSSISYEGFAVCATEGNKVGLTFSLEWRVKRLQACAYTDLVLWHTQSLLLIDWLQTVHQLLWATDLKKYSKCFPGISSLIFLLLCQSQEALNLSFRDGLENDEVDWIFKANIYYSGTSLDTLALKQFPSDVINGLTAK